MPINSARGGFFKISKMHINHSKMSSSDHARHSTNEASQTREEIYNDKGLTF